MAQEGPACAAKAVGKDGKALAGAAKARLDLGRKVRQRVDQRRVPSRDFNDCRNRGAREEVVARKACQALGVQLAV